MISSDPDQPDLGQSQHDQSEPDLHRWLADSDPELTAAPEAGAPADRPDLHPRPDRLATAIGAGLARLHALPVDGFPGPTGSAHLLAVARSRVDADLVVQAELPEPYCRYRPERLLDLAVDGTERGDRADRDRSASVVCHGNPVPSLMMVDGDRFAGFLGVGDMVIADRHLDLAIAQQAVHRILGAEAVFMMYDGYGADPDITALDHHVLLALLLGRGLD